MSIKGYSGSVTADTTEVGTAKIWTLDMTASETDSTTFADGGWSAVCSGLKTWGGSITVMYDAGGDAGEDELIQSFIGGSEIALELLTGGSSGTGTAEKFSGNAVVTNMPITNDVNSCLEVTFGFSGRGALTVGTLV